jgi:hypothetical protein
VDRLEVLGYLQCGQSLPAKASDAVVSDTCFCQPVNRHIELNIFLESTGDCRCY